jgi:hypothetical protein
MINQVTPAPIAALTIALSTIGGILIMRKLPADATYRAQIGFAPEMFLREMPAPDGQRAPLGNRRDHHLFTGQGFETERFLLRSPKNYAIFRLVGIDSLVSCVVNRQVSFTRW